MAEWVPPPIDHMVEKFHRVIMVEEGGRLPSNIMWAPKSLRKKRVGGNRIEPLALLPNVVEWCNEHIGPIEIVHVKWMNTNGKDHCNMRYAIQFASPGDVFVFMMNFGISVNQNNDKVRTD